ncbi:hypothetical protein D3C78_1215640 [compost metagenome]
MNKLLEFSEHRLTEYCCPELVRIISQQIELLLRICRVFQQIIHQQSFVGRRGYFSQEDRILSITILQIFIREVRMEGMPHFMSQCEHAVQVIFMIEQNKRMCTVSAPTICTSTFALIFVNIDPAVVEAIIKHFKVIVSQWLKTFKNHFFSFVI